MYSTIRKKVMISFYNLMPEQIAKNKITDVLNLEHSLATHCNQQSNLIALFGHALVYNVHAFRCQIQD